MIDINCDLGEGLDNDEALMPFISSCNIACGGHAGDETTMNKAIALALEHNVKIGAHPSYPDRENFGRKSMNIRQEALTNSFKEQVFLLQDLASGQDARIHHIKPHGALYNDLIHDSKLAYIFVNALGPFRNRSKLYVPKESEVYYEGKKQGFEVVCEAFADRNYNDDLSLVPREEHNATITDAEQVIAHLKEMVRNNQVKTVTGKLVPIEATTYCVHSDTTNAVAIVKAISEAFIVK